MPFGWILGEIGVRRIAYAASFGVDKCPSGLQAELSGRLSRFDALSVREESGVSICQAAGKEAVHVLDPTLLLSKDDYLSLMEDIRESFLLTCIYIVSISLRRRIYDGRNFEGLPRGRDYR